MAAILRSGLAGGLRMVLNGYGLRPQYYVRSFCKAPPDDAKPNVAASIKEKKGVQTEGKPAATQRVEETEERLATKKEDTKVEVREEIVDEKAAQEIEASSLEGKVTEGNVLREKPEAVQKVEDLVAKEPEAVQKVEDLVAKDQDAVQKVEDLVAKEPEAVQKVEDLVAKEPEAVQKVEDLVAKEPEAVQKVEDFVAKEPEAVQKVEDLVAKEQEAVQEVESLVKEEQETVQKVEDLVAKEPEAVQKVENLVAKEQEAAQEVESLVKEEQETVQKVEDLVAKEQEAVQKVENLVAKEQEAAQEVESLVKEEKETIQKVEDLVAKEPEAVQKVENLVAKEQEAAQEVESLVKEEQETVQKVEDLVAKEPEAVQKVEDLVAKEQEAVQEVESLVKEEQETAQKVEDLVAKEQEAVQEGETATAQEVEGPSAEELKSETPIDETSEKVGAVLEEGRETAQKVEDAVEDKKVAAQNKLHDLLTSLATTDLIPVEPLVKLSKPKARRQKKAKSEPVETAAPTPEESIEPELLSATEEVAESLGGDVEGTKSELLSALRSHSPEADDKPAVSLSELFVGMKVEKSTSKPAKAFQEYPRRKRFEQDSEAKGQGHRGGEGRMWSKASSRPLPRTLARVDLFGAEPLGIFAKSSDGAAAAASRLQVWEAAHRREQQQCVAHPPSNAFTEMMQWTDRGILWTFPIDNEFGLEEEKEVGFHEHIFLERHLEGWCPRRGPVRHFMELVCTGLSKNPHLTVQRKRAHIEWYKSYFAEKEDLLREIGAIESSKAN